MFVVGSFGSFPEKAAATFPITRLMDGRIPPARIDAIVPNTRRAWSFASR